MKRTGWTTVGGLAAIAATLGGTAGPAGADEGADPAVVAARQEAAAQPHPADYRRPPDVAPVGPSGANDDPRTHRLSDLYYLSAVSTSGGYIEVAARDNPALDTPGPATTTLRVYGNAAGFRTNNGNLGLNSKFTCTGTGISGLTVGASGASVSGGSVSSTLTWPSLRESASVLRQYYTEGGHFRCKASNLSPAKFTRRATASATYKNVDTRAEDSYSFAW